MVAFYSYVVSYQRNIHKGILLIHSYFFINFGALFEVAVIHFTIAIF